MTETTANSPYATYWKAWTALLVITLVMVFAGETSTAIIIIGMLHRRSLRNLLDLDDSLAWAQPLAALITAIMIIASSHTFAGALFGRLSDGIHSQG